MFWMVTRHGTQYPPPDLSARLRERLPVIRKTVLQNHKEKRGNISKTVKTKHTVHIGAVT